MIKPTEGTILTVAREAGKAAKAAAADSNALYAFEQGQPPSRFRSSRRYRRPALSTPVTAPIMVVNALDLAQQSAATGTGDIQLVLAGPGSGKTTTLAGRFVHLVRQGVDRRRILALTFTKKAADEMKSRIAAALDLPSAADLSIATFHGFAFRIELRQPLPDDGFLVPSALPGEVDQFLDQHLHVRLP